MLDFLFISVGFYILLAIFGMIFYPLWKDLDELSGSFTDDECYFYTEEGNCAENYYRCQKLLLSLRPD